MKTHNLLTSTPAPIRLHIPDFRRVALTLVGLGGTGSHIASGLIAIAQALGDRGIASYILFVDPDIVEPKNVGRQLFSAADIGQPKAQVVADRLNAAFGTRIGASVRAIEEQDICVPENRGDQQGSPLQVVIGAVDNAAARAVMARAVKKADGKLWALDCGNENHSGQIALGNIANANNLKGAIALGMTDRLPAPHLVYPDLIKSPKAKNPHPTLPRRKNSDRGGARAPSCAELTAAGEQALMVNRVIAAYALELLHVFLVTREVRWFALALDLQWGGAKAYTLDVPTLAAVTGLSCDQLVAKGKPE